MQLLQLGTSDLADRWAVHPLIAIAGGRPKSWKSLNCSTLLYRLSSSNFQLQMALRFPLQHTGRIAELNFLNPVGRPSTIDGEKMPHLVD